MKSQNNHRIFPESQQKNQQQNSQQKLKIPCYYHPNQVITNFCLNEKCLMPLCPICVQQHSQEHYEINEVIQLQHIDEVQQSCEYNLKKILEEKQKSQQLLEEGKKNLEGDQQIEEFLAEKKKQCQKIIDDYFDQTKNAYLKYCAQNKQQSTNEFDQQYVQLNALDKDLNKYLKQMNNPNKMLSAAIKLLTTDYFNATSQYLSEFNNKLYAFQQKQIYLAVNEEELVNLNTCLGRFIQIENQPHAIHQQQLQHPNYHSFQNNKPMHNQPQIPQSRPIQQSEFMVPQSNMRPNPTTPLNCKKIQKKNFIKDYHHPQNENQMPIRPEMQQTNYIKPQSIMPGQIPQNTMPYNQMPGQMPYNSMTGQMPYNSMPGQMPQNSYMEPQSNYLQPQKDIYQTQQYPHPNYMQSQQQIPQLRTSYQPQNANPQQISELRQNRQTPFGQSYNY